MCRTIDNARGRFVHRIEYSNRVGTQVCLVIPKRINSFVPSILVHHRCDQLEPAVAYLICSRADVSKAIFGRRTELFRPGVVVKAVYNRVSNRSRDE